MSVRLCCTHSILWIGFDGAMWFFITLQLIIIPVYKLGEATKNCDIYIWKVLLILFLCMK